jgi:hypothetical protein
VVPIAISLYLIQSWLLATNPDQDGYRILRDPKQYSMRIVVQFEFKLRVTSLVHASAAILSFPDQP